MNRTALILLILLSFVGAVACGASQSSDDQEETIEATGDEVVEQVVEATEEERPRVPPPESGPARDIAFPPITRSELSNGLELNVVRYEQLPVVYLRLVIRSGAETDPESLQGLSNLVAQMLQEGTRRRSSAELAEAIEFLGADMGTAADEENVHLVFRALSEHLDEAMNILAEVATMPAFDPEELQKLKRRERDRLSLMSKRPNFLARRAFYRAAYGENHPYGRVDTTEEVLQRVSRRDLQRWHRRHFVPANAFLVAVGDVTPEQVRESAGRAFRRWSGSAAPARREFPALPAASDRRVIVVDRPGAVQSVIVIGNLAIAREHEDWVSLMVANQVLGGSAASRLFMDLRERRSLTYGAYSQVGERIGVGPFLAFAQVRTDVTAQAVSAFFENFEAIVTEAPPADELRNAQRYLSDSFPLDIDTPGKIAKLVADLRIFGLSDDYWDSFRTRIGETTSEQALAAAQAHIHPEQSIVLVVGEAGAIAESLRPWGPLTVLNESGEVQAELSAQPAEENSEAAAAE